MYDSDPQNAAPKPKIDDCLYSLQDLITGTSKSGIGAAVATSLAAASPNLLILASRNESRVTPVINDIKQKAPHVETVFVHLDLLDIATIQTAVDKIKTLTTKIDGLINNAGVMGAEAYITSKQGVESQFATNHLGCFLFTNLLLRDGLVGGGDYCEYGEFGISWGR